jgi:hypothetical protein
MAEHLIPRLPPVTAEDCHDLDGNPGWASRVKSAVALNGEALRANPVDLSIEAKSLRTNVWQPIMLPGNGTRFATEADLKAVLAMVVGEAEIPNRVTSK